MAMSSSDGGVMFGALSVTWLSQLGPARRSAYVYSSAGCGTSGIPSAPTMVTLYVKPASRFVLQRRGQTTSRVIISIVTSRGSYVAFAASLTTRVYTFLSAVRSNWTPPTPRVHSMRDMFVSEMPGRLTVYAVVSELEVDGPVVPHSLALNYTV